MRPPDGPALSYASTLCDGRDRGPVTAHRDQGARRAGDEWGSSIEHQIHQDGLVRPSDRLAPKIRRVLLGLQHGADFAGDGS